MNTLKTIFCAGSLFSVLLLSGQEKTFPPPIPVNTKVEVSPDSLETLFHCTSRCSLQLTPTLSISGQMEDREEKGPMVRTVLIRTDNQGAMLSLSRLTKQDGSVSYTGRLLKLHEADGLLLLEKDRRYYFVRTQERFLVAE